MNISFWGSSSFSLEILKALHEKHTNGLINLVYVVSQPAKPVGRNKLLSNNLVAQYAIDNDLKLYTPAKLKELFNHEYLTQHQELYTDLSFVAAYGKIISKSSPPRTPSFSSTKALTSNASRKRSRRT